MNHKRLTQTATVIPQSEGAEDEYGNSILDWHSADGVDFKALLQPTSSEETEEDRDTRTSMFRLILEPSSAGVVTATSRATVDGKEYEVIGEPEVHRLRVRVSHVECNVRRIEG